MNFSFTKMHGLGNDFIVINGIDQTINLAPEQIKAMSDRHTGIGFDQLLLVEESNDELADFKYRIFNADGGEVEHCGNGARCFARFVRDQGLTNKTEIPVTTQKGLITLFVEDNNQVKVDMGIPAFDPPSIPLNRDEQAITYAFKIDGESFEFGALSIGNPHAVVIVDDIDTAPVNTVGPIIEQHKDFPARVNVGFMQIIDRNTIKLRVFERGAGETMACGTGACAAVISGITRELLDKEVTVKLPGGQLNIQWNGENTPVFMTGPTANVFTGTMTL